MRHLGMVLALVLAITVGIGEARALGAGGMRDAAGVGTFHGARKMLQSCSVCPSTGEHWECECSILRSWLTLFVGALRGMRLARAGRPSALCLPLHGHPRWHGLSHAFTPAKPLRALTPAAAAASACQALSSSEQSQIRNMLIYSCSGTLTPGSSSTSATRV